MKLIKLLRIGGKVLMFGFLLGFRLMQTYQQYRRSRPSSWINRTRFYRLLHALKPVVKVIVIAGILLFGFIVFA